MVGRKENKLWLFLQVTVVWHYLGRYLARYVGITPVLETWCDYVGHSDRIWGKLTSKDDSVLISQIH